jgi:hypothetical protein
MENRMTFQTGEVAYVKSTEEPLVVFGVRPFEDKDRGNFPDFLEIKELVVVRRPIVTENGAVHYKLFDFAPFEIETALEHSKRLYNNLKERQALAMGDDEGPLSFLSANSKKPSIS